MELYDKDILGVILSQIDDFKTVYNFAIADKRCARVLNRFKKQTADRFTKIVYIPFNYNYYVHRLPNHKLHGLHRDKNGLYWEYEYGEYKCQQKYDAKTRIFTPYS